ncbi:MAG: Mpo1-like protein, partial [Candidatus Thiodiazotropha sp. LLP2]
LHARLALGMLVFILPVLYTSEVMVASPHALWIAISVFVIGWIFQLIGHKYEKAKPAFIDDLNQLLIGPLFLMAEVYFALGWEKSLAQEIEPIAHRKRMALETAKGG